MRVAVVADAHLGGPGGSAEPFIDQLRGAVKEGDRLILLGDLFHVWVGDRRYETPEIRAVAPFLEGLRRAGVWIGYVEGNRDFFLQTSPYAAAFDRIARELTIELAETRCLFVHGDGLDAGDRKYRFWRWLSKSPPSRAIFGRLPGGVARRIAFGTERRLARSNFKHKTHIPERVLRDYAERRLSGGLDVLLLGHFHEARRYSVAGGEAIVVDAWFNDRRVQFLDELLTVRGRNAE